MQSNSPKADLDPRAETGPGVGWNSLLKWLNLHFGAETHLFFNFQWICPSHITSLYDPKKPLSACSGSLPNGYYLASGSGEALGNVMILVLELN